MFLSLLEPSDLSGRTAAAEPYDDPTAVLLARPASLRSGPTVGVGVVGDRAVVAFSGAGGLAEVSAKGVTKAAALAGWCAELGIDAGEVWAFGDMPNDLPMLTWAGRSFAVANAHDDVLAAAIRAGCRYLLSEDYQHGRTVRGTTILNPFTVGPEAIATERRAKAPTR